MAIWRFEESGVDYGQLLSGTYSVPVVLLSVLIACIAGFTALTVADRINNVNNLKMRYLWLSLGATTMGLGIWAMHFTGMLAFSMGMPINYSIPITILSVVPAILGSAVALHLLSAPYVNWRRNQICALSLATCIGAMHFIGMEAMLMPSLLKYDPFYFILSILIAHVLASIALYIKFVNYSSTSLLKKYQDYISAIVMGCSVSGMHYIAMESAHIYAAETMLPHDSMMSRNVLLITVITIISLILATVIIVAYLDRMLKKISLALDTTKQDSKRVKEKYRQIVEEANVLLWEADIDTFQFTYMSPQSEIITGYTAWEWCQPDFWAEHIFHEDKKQAVQYCQESTAKKQDHIVEYRFVKADGSVLWLHDTVKVVCNDQGIPEKLRGVLIDITERK